ncbi:MAG: hypothetical protein ACP5NS_04060 [Candidatus Pacearchaeota archaeon]
MINTTNVEEAKRLLKKEESPKLVLAQDDDFNRKIAEQAKFDVIISLEAGNRKNKIRQTDSGLNHVLASILSKNKIAMGINLEELKSLEPKIKAERLAKIKQNIKISRKSGVQLAIKIKNYKEAAYFLQSMGASTIQSKEAIVF